MKSMGVASGYGCMEVYTVQEDLLARTLFWRLAICSIFRQYLKRQQNIYGY